MIDRMPASTRAEGTSLTTTNATTVYTAIGGNMREMLNAVFVSNVTGTDATVTVVWTNDADSADYSLATGMTVPANGSVWLRPIGLPLASGDLIKVTAGTSDALDVIVMLSELGRGGGNN